MSVVEINRGADAAFVVRWRGVNLTGYAFAVLDAGARFTGFLTVSFTAWDPTVVVDGDTVGESTLLVTVEGTSPLSLGDGGFRIQATLGGASVSTPVIRLRVV